MQENLGIHQSSKKWYAYLDSNFRCDTLMAAALNWLLLSLLIWPHCTAASAPSLVGGLVFVPDSTFNLWELLI